MTRITLIVLVALLGSACASSRYCIGEQPYHSAQTVPPLEGTGELVVPSSQTALIVPDAPAGGEPYGKIVTDEDGDERAVCLDTPPELPPLPPVEPPAEAS